MHTTMDILTLDDLSNAVIKSGLTVRAELQNQSDKDTSCWTTLIYVLIVFNFYSTR